MEFPGFNSPSASTEAPLEMLSACHHRIERQCTTLGRLVTHVDHHGADPQARVAAQNVIRYFDSSALDHHADEERDLFPALLESMAGSDPVCIRELVSRLCADHRRLETAWQALRPILLDIAEGKNVQLPGEQVEMFTSLYAEHLKCEEDELLPMAQRLLSNSDIARIGRAMRERRGIGDELL